MQSLNPETKVAEFTAAFINTAKDPSFLASAAAAVALMGVACTVISCAFPSVRNKTHQLASAAIGKLSTLFRPCCANTVTQQIDQAERGELKAPLISPDSRPAPSPGPSDRFPVTRPGM